MANSCLRGINVGPELGSKNISQVRPKICLPSRVCQLRLLQPSFMTYPPYGYGDIIAERVWAILTLSRSLHSRQPPLRKGAQIIDCTIDEDGNSAVGREMNNFVSNVVQLSFTGRYNNNTFTKTFGVQWDVCRRMD